MISNTKKIHLLIFFAGVIGLLLFFGITDVCAQASKTLVDLNTASEKELEEIKGVGPATAKKIIAGRPYKSVDDLKKVGIPDKTIESMKPYIKVGAAPGATKPTIETKPTTPTKAVTETKQATTAKPTTAPKEAVKAAPVPPAPSKTQGETKATKTPAKAKDKEAPAVKLAPGQKVNINTATKEELEALPEVGPVKAQAIIDGRPYKAPEDVMKVKGIKEGTFNKIKDYIVVK